MKLFQAWFDRRSKSGKESVMAEEANKQTPPANPGGEGKIDVAAIVKSVTDAVVASLGERLSGVEKNQKVLADTLAAQKTLTSEDVNQAIAAQLKSRDEATAKDQAKAQLRAKVIKEKLGGDEELAGFLPDSDDEAALTAAAEKLTARVKPKGDFGGADKNGGKPPASEQPPALNPNLPKGVAAYAAAMTKPA